MVAFCSVPQCKSRKEPGISFHLYPKPSRLKKAWLIKLRMGKPAPKYALVCSKHFQEEDFVYPVYKVLGYKCRKLSAEAIPSANLPVRPHDRMRSCEGPEKRRRERHNAAHPHQLPQPSISIQLDPLITQESTENGDSCLVEDVSGVAAQGVEPMEGDSLLIRMLPTPEPVEVSTATNANASPIPDMGLDNHVPTCEVVNAELDKFRQETGVQVDTTSSPFRDNQLITISKVVDENGLLVLSGICSFELFYNITELYTEARTLRSSRSFCLGDDDVVLLTFMKLYHNITFSLLGVLFGIHRTTASNMFKESVVVLASILEHAVFWPEKEAVVSCLTTYFWQYKETRMVLDCTEIEIERPKDLVSRLLTYSHYKRTYTAKVLVSETPGGLISYVSPAYGGKASDTFITKESQILDKCIPHIDSVMVDKGFLINELCREKNVKMIRPPFLMEKQLTAEEARANQSIASARVHVERAIQRMKLFRILRHRFDLDLLPYIDKIFTVISGIVNLSKPLFSENKFLFQ